jgi:hypothetical protein
VHALQLIGLHQQNAEEIFVETMCKQLFFARTTPTTQMLTCEVHADIFLNAYTLHRRALVDIQIANCWIEYFRY